MTNSVPECLLNNVWGQESVKRDVIKKVEAKDGLTFYFARLNREYNSNESVYPCVCVTNTGDEAKTIFSDYSDNSGYIICEMVSEDGEIKFEENINKSENGTAQRYTKELKPGESIKVYFSTSVENAKTGNYLMNVHLNCINDENKASTVSVSVPVKIYETKNVTKTYKDSAGNEYVLVMDSKEEVVYAISSESVTLEAVVIPDNVTSINVDSENLNKIKYFVLPESVTDITNDLGSSWKAISFLTEKEIEKDILSKIGMQHTSQTEENEIRVVYVKDDVNRSNLESYGENVLVIVADKYDMKQVQTALLMAQGKINEQVDLRTYVKGNKVKLLFDEDGNGKVDVEDARIIYEKVKGKSVTDIEWTNYCEGKTIIDDYAYESPLLYGDFDLDGKVTLKDAKKALAISLGIDKSTDNDNYIGNINGKGITLIEAKTILRMSIGIEKSKAIS